jgi:hypothetical protein
MRVRARLAAPVAAMAVLCGCAYIGDPLPPLANVPSSVNDLAAVERASRIIVHFTVPALTTEGVAIKTPLKLDLRVGTESGAGGFDPAAWAAQAKPVPGGVVEKGLAAFTIPTADWIGKTVTIGVRVTGANGKSSHWSNFVNLTVVPPPEKPRSLRAEATANGVRLTWEDGGGTFRVFRRAGDQKEFARVADVSRPEWTDPDAQYGQSYAYIVQRIVKPAEHREAESEPSDPVEITPKDTFPPAAPTGLRASAAPSSIELSWERNTEPDLAGYRVYRSVDAGPFERVAEVSQVPAWSDQMVERGKTYRYAVTAVDQAGNESARSAVVESTL